MVGETSYEHIVLDRPLDGLVAPLLPTSEDVVRWAFDTFITPEVMRRQEAGHAEKPMPLWRAQVIFHVSAAPLVRLNEEVRGTMWARATRDMVEGEDVYAEDFDEVSAIDVSDDDPNAAHITLLLHNDSWIGAFDFRYNGVRAQEHLTAADEFLAAADTDLVNARMRPFVDNLLSGTELTAKAALLQLPLQSLLASKTHEHFAGLYNYWAKLGNASPDYAALLNGLRELRKKARYLESPFTLTDKTATEMLETARRMHADTAAVRAVP